MPHRPDIDLDLEEARMAEAAELRVCVERKWRRDRGGQLTGPWGRMMRREIESRFNSGPPSSVLGSNSEPHLTGRYDRWDQLAALADLGFDPLGEIVEEQALLYREPIQIRGELGASTVWMWLRTRSGLDKALMKRQRMELALGSAVVRPVFKPWRNGVYHPPGLTVIPPDQCIAIADPTAPGRLITYAERIPPQGRYGREHWLAWDISDPGAPYWGRWESLEGWASGRSPTWIMEGLDYPTWWEGMPLMPAVASQSSPEATEPLPGMPGIAQGVKDLTIQRMWCLLVAYVGSFNQTVIVSEGPAQGLGQLQLDPVTVGNIWGGLGSVVPQLATIPHSLDGAKIHWDLHRDRAQEWAQGINRAFQVRQSEAAKSGTALLIELTGQVQAANEAETRCEPVDREIIIALAASLNYLARSNQIRLAMKRDGSPHWSPHHGSAGPQWLIPESSDMEIGYPRRWNEVERQRQRAEIQTAVDAHLEPPQAMWLFDHDLEDDRPDGINWQTATSAINYSLAEAQRMATAGYGVPWKDLWLGPKGASASLTVEKSTDAEGGGALMVGQIEGTRSIITDVASGKIPRDVGIAQMVGMIGVTAEVANSMLGPIGAGYQPPKPEGYDPALRETTGADVQATQAAAALAAIGIPAEQISAFLALRGVMPAGATLAQADEAVTYTPPPDVARTAAKGLSLRDSYGRGLGAGTGAAMMSGQDKRLLARAKRLREAAPMTGGEVLDLDVWLEAHQSDGEKPTDDGEWGNDADPSAAYVEWLTQGGDPGLAWTNATLSEEPSGDQGEESGAGAEGEPGGVATGGPEPEPAPTP